MCKIWAAKVLLRGSSDLAIKDAIETQTKGKRNRITLVPNEICETQLSQFSYGKRKLKATPIKRENMKKFLQKQVTGEQENIMNS